MIKSLKKSDTKLITCIGFWSDVVMPLEAFLFGAIFEMCITYLILSELFF